MDLYWNRDTGFLFLVVVGFGAIMFWAYTERSVELYYAFRWATTNWKVDWIDRLALLGIIEEEDYHREIGKVYDIPKCCREWFICLICKVKVENPLVFSDRNYGEDKIVGYVRCPECRKGRA